MMSCLGWKVEYLNILSLRAILKYQKPKKLTLKLVKVEYL